MHELGSEDEIFSSRIPGLVEEDGDLAERNEANDVNDSIDDDDDEEDDHQESLDSIEGHVHGKRSRLHPFLPAKAYAVFALAVVLSLVCYIAIPIVCLSTSHRVIEDRNNMASVVVIPSDWASKIIDLDRLETRLKVFAMYGDAMLLPGDNDTSTITLTTRTASGKEVLTPSPVVASILSEIEAVFSDLDATFRLLLLRSSRASVQLSSAFQSSTASLRSYLTSSFVAEVTRLFDSRRQSRQSLWELHRLIFMEILPPAASTHIARLIGLFADAKALCAQTPVCSEGGGADLLESLRRNATGAAFRELYIVGDLISFINDIQASVVTADQMLSTVNEWNTFLDDEMLMMQASTSLFESTLLELRRLESLQASFNGTLNTTGATSPSPNETSLVAMLSPAWSTHVIESVEGNLANGQLALALLSTQVDAQIRKLLSAQSITGGGLEIRMVQPVSLYDSIYAYNFDQLGAPDETTYNAAFNTNFLNTFFKTTRTAYEILMQEATDEATSAVVAEEENATGASSIDKIQITVSICAIAPVAFMMYLVVGVSVRLPESPVPYHSLVRWIGFTYAILVAAAAAMSMIAINQINETISIHSPELQAVTSINLGAERSSSVLGQAMGALLLVQPNTSAPALNVIGAMNRYATIASEGLDAPYTSPIGMILQNMSTPFLQAPLSAQLFREILSSETSWISARVSAYEGLTSVAQFDALPACNQSRVLGVSNFLLDSYGALQRILDIAHLAESPLSSRIAFQPTRAAKLLACTFCGAEASKLANAGCLRPTPIGLQNHPRDTGAFTQSVMYVTRSGWSIDAWNTTTYAMAEHIAQGKSTLSQLAQFDSTAWKHRRRLIVWLAVFGALGLQLIWYVLWRGVFDNTLHANLLP